MYTGEITCLHSARTDVFRRQRYQIWTTGPVPAIRGLSDLKCLTAEVLRGMSTICNARRACLVCGCMHQLQRVVPAIPMHWILPRSDMQHHARLKASTAQKTVHLVLEVRTAGVATTVIRPGPSSCTHCGLLGRYWALHGLGLSCHCVRAQLSEKWLAPAGQYATLPENTAPRTLSSLVLSIASSFGARL